MDTYCTERYLPSLPRQYFSAAPWLIITVHASSPGLESGTSVWYRLSSATHHSGSLLCCQFCSLMLPSPRFLPPRSRVRVSNEFQSYHLFPPPSPIEYPLQYGQSCNYGSDSPMLIYHSQPTNSSSFAGR